MCKIVFFSSSFLLFVSFTPSYPPSFSIKHYFYFSSIIWLKITRSLIATGVDDGPTIRISGDSWRNAVYLPPDCGVKINQFSFPDIYRNVENLHSYAIPEVVLINNDEIFKAIFFQIEFLWNVYMHTCRLSIPTSARGQPCHITFHVSLSRSPIFFFKHLSIWYKKKSQNWRNCNFRRFFLHTQTLIISKYEL